MAKIKILRASSILENSALLYTEQPDFLNQILECDCRLDPYDLLANLLLLEETMGRVRQFSKGPREIDLDILSQGKLLIQSARLCLPHPGLKDRPYLHRLLNELGVDCRQLVKNCTMSYQSGSFV